MRKLGVSTRLIVVLLRDKVGIIISIFSILKSSATLTMHHQVLQYQSNIVTESKKPLFFRQSNSTIPTHTVVYITTTAFSSENLPQVRILVPLQQRLVSFSK